MVEVVEVVEVVEMVEMNAIFLNGKKEIENSNERSMEGYVYSFEKLEAWKNAKNLSVAIYKLTQKFPDHERFGLISQMRRAVISIASNLAEGSGRVSDKDQSHFYTVTYSSAIELLNQLIISFELSIISESELSEARSKIERVTFGINQLKKSLKD